MPLPWQIVLCLMLLLFAVVGCSKSKPAGYRVGIVCGADLILPVFDGLKAKLTEFGFFEGVNIRYEIHPFNDDPAREQRAAEDLVANKVGLIVTMPTRPAASPWRC